MGYIICSKDESDKRLRRQEHDTKKSHVYIFIIIENIRDSKLGLFDYIDIIL